MLRHVCVNLHRALGVSDVTAPDPGPMARFEALVREAGTMGVVVQRLTEGETLKEMARAWEVPYGKLAEWIVESKDRSERYARATQVWVDALARSTVATARDAAVEPTKVGIAAAKLVIDTNFRIAGKLFREQYGDSSQVSLSVKDEMLLDRDAMVLEAARTVAYLLAQGAEIAGRNAVPLQLAAPVEAETAAPADSADKTHDAAHDAGPI